MTPILTSRASNSALAFGRGFGTAGFAPVDAYYNITSTSLSASATTIDFSNIDGSYEHLEIRFCGRFQGSGGTSRFRVGSGSVSTSTSLFYTTLYSDGSSFSNTGVNDSDLYLGYGNENTNLTTFEIIFFNYARTDRAKSFIANVTNKPTSGGGHIGVLAGVWNNTGALTHFQFRRQLNDYSSGTEISFYGIKGTE